MAGGLTRRGFLGGAAAGAAVLAARPSWSAPAAGPRVVPVRLPQEPPFERLRALIPLGSDEFECERRAVEVGRVLDRLIADGSPPTTADFSGASPMPAAHDDLGPDAAVARFDLADRDFEGGLRRWLEALGPRPRARFYPIEDGLVRYEIVSGEGAERRYRVGQWRIGWRDGRLSSFEPLDETLAKGPARFERDDGVFAHPQLAVGVPEWRRRLDSASGIDVYGQNGVAVGDIDGDGWDEIYVCQPGGLPNLLFKRNASGTYEEISAAAGVDLLDSTSAALFLDLRNNGLRDLVVLAAAAPLCFLNQGDGTFHLAEDAFRFASPPSGTFTGMAAADYDGDGRLDLYVCSYIYFQSEDQYSYPAPYHDARNGPPNFLFRNRPAADGGVVFEDVTAAVGLDENNDRYSFAPAWADYDFDGRPELYVANDFGRNNLYKFDGRRFLDIAAEAGVEDVGPGMSAAWFDADGDGRPDLYVTNMWTAAGRRVVHDPAFSLVAEHGLTEAYRRHTKGNTLYLNRGDGTFKESGEAEMGRWSWAGDAFDFDGDGAPAILVAAGMITEPSNEAAPPDLMSFFWRQTAARSSATAAPSPAYEEGWNAINQFIREGISWNGGEPNVFYRRRGDRWIDFSGIEEFGALDTRSFAAVDLTGDGRLDLVLKNRLGPQLTAFFNRAGDSGGGRALVIELRGRRSNRDAIGAWVVVETDQFKRGQGLSAGSGYLCQHARRLHFGLGSAAAARRVEVRWPLGKVQGFADLPGEFRYLIDEDEGVVERVPIEAGERPRPAPAASRRLPATDDVWLLEPVPLPEKRRGPGLLVIAQGRSAAPDPSEVVDLESSPPEVAARFALFQRYLLDHRGPLVAPLALLVDGDSQAHKLYRRVPSQGELDADLRAMEQADRRSRALPFAGRYHAAPSRNYFRHGAAFYQAGFAEEALPYFEAVLARDGNNFKARLAVGQIHLAAERLDAARTQLEAAARLNPNSAEVWNNIGGLEMARESYPAAMANFEKALALNPEAPYALVNAAQVQNRLGRLAEAEHLYRKALEKKPDDADAADQLGLLLAKQDRFDEAARLFQRAIELRRDHASAINNLAVLYLRTNRPDEAEAALRYGIRAAPGEERMYLNLARLYVQRGDSRRARSVIEQLLTERPDSEAGRRALRELSAP